jgi:hypothetical protein
MSSFYVNFFLHFKMQELLSLRLQRHEKETVTFHPIPGMCSQQGHLPMRRRRRKRKHGV